MIQGTGSDVGKSVLVAGLCRVMRQDGVRVAPFKPRTWLSTPSSPKRAGRWGGRRSCRPRQQGPAPRGHEPGAAQAHDRRRRPGHPPGQGARQHEGAGVPRLQEDRPKDRLRELSEAFAPLRRHPRRGAGSPAEINLREGDIANMGFALEARSPVLLVGDIDKGGVFASIVGTLELVSPEERDLIRGSSSTSSGATRACSSPPSRRSGPGPASRSSASSPISATSSSRKRTASTPRRSAPGPADRPSGSPSWSPTGSATSRTSTPSWAKRG